MLSKLTRILLALVTAFVFTGQMQAAAEHCARLAHEAVAQESEVAPPCHDIADSVAMAHGQSATETPPHHPPADEPASQAPDHCECVAALNGFANVSGALASSHVAPYVWLPPQAAGFASSHPDPDLRPPRA